MRFVFQVSEVKMGTVNQQFILQAVVESAVLILITHHKYCPDKGAAGKLPAV